MRIFQHANYPFMQWRRRAYIITAVLLLAGLAGMIKNVGQYGSWLNYGVDFKGGTLVQLKFDNAVQADQIRAAAAAAGHDDWEITTFGGANEFVIRTGAFSGQLEQTAEQQVQQALSSRFPADQYEVVRTEAVGAKVGDELQFRALMAILLSFVGHHAVPVGAVRVALRPGGHRGHGARHLHHPGDPGHHGQRGVAGHGGGVPDHRGLLAERHHRGVRPHPRGPEQAAPRPQLHGGPEPRPSTRRCPARCSRRRARW